jgi:mannose-6-phosphate isomerase-like protein (cupin superfamily)
MFPETVDLVAACADLSHEAEDELFLVLKGRLVIEYEGGRRVDLPAGSFHVVPRGVAHNPVATEECWIALVETVTTLHTGTVDTPRSKTIQDQLRQIT